MKIAAVSVISFSDNRIMQAIVKVKDDATWKQAFAKSVQIGIYKDIDSDSDIDDGHLEWILEQSDDLEEARSVFADAEMDICVTFKQL